MEKKAISHFVAGIIIGLVLIVFFLAFYFTGNTFNKGPLSYLPTLIFMGALIYFIIQWANANNNNVTFGQCFKYGFKTTAIVAIIMTIFIAAFIFALPEYKEKFVEFMSSEMEKESSQITDDQKEKALEMMEKFIILKNILSTIEIEIVH
ncbi:MAG: DUF4199 domain-containing protein [Pedobacter sp.]|nr:MAG: DUF4199 domain-containing protein [Pedobacter sp.]